MRKAHHVSSSSDTSDTAENDDGGNITSESSVSATDEYEHRASSLEPIVSSPPAGIRVGPGRRSRYSMNYQSYEATRIQPAEQTRRMLDYMFPGYQKRDPRNWYEKATQTNLNRKEVGGLIGTELMEIEPVEVEEKPVVDKISHIPVDDDDDDSPSKTKGKSGTEKRVEKERKGRENRPENTVSYLKCAKKSPSADPNIKSSKTHARSSVVAKGWDGPPIKVFGKASEEGFHIEIRDRRHEPQAITVPKEIFDQRTLRLDVVPDERGVPKVVVFVGDPERSSDSTVDSNMPEASTVMIFDNKDDFHSRSISITSEEEEREPSPEPVIEPVPVPVPVIVPVPVPPPTEPSSDEFVVHPRSARDSLIERPVSESHVAIEYDLDDEPEEKEVEESEPKFAISREIINSRLLEPVYSEGGKSDVYVEEMDAPAESDSDQNLSKEVSDWLAAEIFPKAMTPRKSESPRKKSESPEPKELQREPTPEPKELTPEPIPEPKELTPQPIPEPTPKPKEPSPEPLPVPHPEPERNLSKDVSDWLNKNIFDYAKKKAEADKKKPEPVQPLKELEPSFTKDGRHASDPGDRLFSPLENYPNNMDEDNLTSANIPTIPLLAPSQVSKNDEPLRALEDYPPQYSSSHSSPSKSRRASDSHKSPSLNAVETDKPMKALEDYPPQYSSPSISPSKSRKASDSPKSPSPKAFDKDPKKPEPFLKAGSHSSSPGDRLFSPLEDHPSNVSDEHEKFTTSSPKSVSPLAASSTKDKTHDPMPTFDGHSKSISPSSEQPEQFEHTAKLPSITIEDKRHESPTKSITKLSDGSHPARDSPQQIKVKSVSLTNESEPAFRAVPVKKDFATALDETKVTEWLDEEILTPAAAESWVDNKILNKARANVKAKKSSGMPSMDIQPQTESSKRHLNAGQKVPSDEEKLVEDWTENEVLIPAQVDNWVEKKILEKVREKRPSKVTIKTISGERHFSKEIESWVSEEVIEPAAASSFLQLKILQPAEVSVAVGEQILEPAEVSVAVDSQILEPAEVSVAVDDQILKPAEVSVAVDDQILQPASGRGLKPSPPASFKSLSQKSDKSARFDSPAMPVEERKAVPTVQGPPVLIEHKDEEKQVDDDSLSWVDSSHNLSPFHPHPDHPGDGPKSLREDVQSTFPQFPDQKPSSAPSLMYEKLPDSSKSQPSHVVPHSPSPGEQKPNFLAEAPPPQSKDGIASHDVSPLSVPPLPVKPREADSLPSLVIQSSPELDVISTWEVQSPISSNKPETQAEADKDINRVSMLKNANENLTVPRKTSTSSKPEKSETRTSLIEKSKIQQDNYLTRDDDEDYKKQPQQKLSKKQRSSSESDVKRKSSDYFLSEKARHQPHSRKSNSPSFFSRLCSPFRKSKSPSRGNKLSKDSSNADSGSYDYNPPPIPTSGKSLTEPTTKLESRRESISSDDSSKKLSPPKSVIPEPIKEESAENKSVSHMMTAGDTDRIAPIPEQGLQNPLPMIGIDQKAGTDMYSQQLPQGAPLPVYQPPQAHSVGEPTQLETGYLEDILTFSLPKFSDYEEAAKRRLKPEGSVASPRIPHPPKKGFPTFPDYEYLIKQKDDLPSKEHSWYDAEGQPSSSSSASDASEVPQQFDVSTFKASDAVQEKNSEEMGSQIKDAPPMPMPPGNGIPMFSDYHNIPAGEFPIFSDSPKMASSYRLKDNKQPDEILFTPGSNYGLQPLSNLPYPTPLQAPTSSIPGTLQSQYSPQATSQLKVPNLQGSAFHPTETRSQTPWETPNSKPQGSPTHPPSHAPTITRHSYSHPDRPLSELTKPVPQQLSNLYPEKQHIPETSLYNSPPQTNGPQKPEPHTSQQQPANDETYDPTKHQGYPQQSKITRHSYSHPDRPLSELTKSVPQQLSNLYPGKQHIPETSSYDLAQQTNPTFQNPEPYNSQKQRPEKTYDPTEQTTGPTMDNPRPYAPGQPSMMSPKYKTPHLQNPWEIPSSRPYSPNEHLTPSMHRPGDYDQRQMFHPQWPIKQSQGSASTGQPKQEPILTTGLRSPVMPSMGNIDYGNQAQTFGQQGQNQASGPSHPSQKPYTTPSRQNLPPPTAISKHYYTQPDRPLSELLQPWAKHQQQGSPLPNFEGERAGGSRRNDSPLAPGSGIPKFADYDNIVQSSQPQISGDHDLNNGKRKIVTAAEKKAQIEKEMLPITEQMEKLKKQMYLLTSQKGPPIRTGLHSAHTRLPTSLELYNELERRTMEATRKDKEEFRAEQRKKVYEENARRRIRRAIEMSKTIK